MSSEDLFREKVMETAERVSRLEQAHGELKDRVTKLTTTMESTDEKLDTMLNKLTRYESKFGVFLLLAGCVWTALIAGWAQIVAFVKFYFSNPT